MISVDALRSFERRALPIVRADWRTFGNIPTPWITPALCDAALDGSPWAIQYVPTSMATFSRVRRAVECDSRIGLRSSRRPIDRYQLGPWVLEHVRLCVLTQCTEVGLRVEAYGDNRDTPGIGTWCIDRSRRSACIMRERVDASTIPYEVYLDGFVNFGLRFRCVPNRDTLRSRLALDAVRRDPSLIHRLPNEWRTPAVCRAYCRHFKELTAIPPQSMTLEMVLTCVTLRGCNKAETLTKRFQRMKQIAINAVRHSKTRIFSIEQVPRWMRSPVMHASARGETFIDDDHLFNEAFFARPSMRTYPGDIPQNDQGRLYQPALRAQGLSIALRVKALRDAFDDEGRFDYSDHEALQYVSAKLLPTRWLECEAFCIALVEESAAHFTDLPESSRTYAVCLAAVSSVGALLEFVPAVHRTYALCLRAVSACGDAIRFVPECHRTLELCNAAVRNRPLAVAHLEGSPHLSSLRFELGD